MIDWPLVSVIIFLPLIGALIILFIKCRFRCRSTHDGENNRETKVWWKGSWSLKDTNVPCLLFIQVYTSFILWGAMLIWVYRSNFEDFNFHSFNRVTHDCFAKRLDSLGFCRTALSSASHSSKMQVELLPQLEPASALQLLVEL